MKGFGYERSSKRRLKRAGILLTLLFIIFVAAYMVYKVFFIPEPVIEGLEAFNFLTRDKTITLGSKNIQSIDVSVNQGDMKVQLLKDIPTNGEKTYTLQIRPGELQLKDGNATIIVKARSGFFKEVTHEINSTIDTIPPTLEVLKSPFLIYQGSGGFALLRAKDADSVFIRVGSYRFKVPQGTDSESYFVFFPAPLDIGEEGVFYAVAEDAAGNQNVKALSTRQKAEKYKASIINIDDSFIKRVVLPLLNEMDTTDPVSAFKTVNEEWRVKSLQKLSEIAMKTAPEILWEGAFLQLKNSKVMATYGERRTYYYDGKPISESTHLGYDLASVSNALVEAANTGIVRFVGDLGIYGNTVIIDHGLGLMSLYGHLSEMIVKENETVKKGTVIGKTGSTGLAAGDHLHFGILIHGYEVSPLHWWDSHWLRVNVSDTLQEYYDFHL